MGILMTLSNIFKHGTRQDFQKMVKIVWQLCEYNEKESSIVRKLSCKLSQRVALVLLPPKVASWRYQRGNRSLLQNLAPKKITENTFSANFVSEEEMQVPEEIDHIVDVLLRGLGDRDTSVRWSCAKGIGRICMRLPSDFGEEMLEAVLELFNEMEGDSTWNGACLALAELCRRGLVLQGKLVQVLSCVVQALHYDQKKGNRSVGAHVRDAACYVLWAVCRAYAPDTISIQAQMVASSLVHVSLFDREVSVRRAAAAALQESVGRKHFIPHGLQLIEAVNYFSLSSSSECYHILARQVSQWEEYRMPMIQHILDFRLAHWDECLRKHAAVSLANICPLEPNYFSEFILSKILPLCTSTDLKQRHGSSLALSHLLVSLKDIGQEIPENLQSEISGVIPTWEEKRMYRGKGGEQMRCNASVLISAISKYGLDLSQTRKNKKTCRKILQETLDENFRHPNEEVHGLTCTALSAFTSYYYPEEKMQGEKSLVRKAAQEILEKYVQVASSDPVPSATRGYSLALGSFATHFYSLSDFTEKIVMTLCTLCTEHMDPQTRRNACTSLGNLSEMLAQNLVSKNQLFGNLVESLLKASKDSARDDRGDVGSWTRESSLKSLFKVVSNQNFSEMWKAEYSQSFLESILSQIGGKLDRLRWEAGTTLSQLLHQQNPFTENLLHLEILRKHFPRDMAWTDNELVFRTLVKLIPYNSFNRPVFLSCLQKMSIPSETDFSKSIISSLQKINEESFEKLKEMSELVVSIMQEFYKDPFLFEPILSSLHKVVQSGVFNKLKRPDFLFSANVAKYAFWSTKNTSCSVRHLNNVVSLFCTLLSYKEATRPKCLQLIFSFLEHSFPKVRLHASQTLLLAVMAYEDLVDPNNFSRIVEILSKVKWEEQVTQEMQNMREELLQLFSIKGI